MLLILLTSSCRRFSGGRRFLRTKLRYTTGGVECGVWSVVFLCHGPSIGHRHTKSGMRQSVVRLILVKDVTFLARLFTLSLQSLSV
jgi:hypothetical protein